MSKIIKWHIKNNEMHNYGHFHNQWYTFEFHIILAYKINIQVLDSNLPT